MMIVPKWQQDAARPKRHNSPLLIIALLLLTAISVKLAFYASRFWDPKVIGPPHPVTYSHGGSDDYQPGNHPSVNPVVTPTHPTRPSRVRRPINEWYRYRTEAFASPNITVTRNGTTSSGYLFAAPRSLVHRMSAPMIFEDDGTLIWRGPTGESTNTKVQMLNGKPHLTYWRDMRDFIIGHEYGDAHILDTSYNEVYRICPRDMNIITNDRHRYKCNLDMHVLTLTDRGTLISTAYNVTQIDLTAFNGTDKDYIFDSQFYEIDIETQEILFSWKSLDHQDQLPINASRVPANRRPGASSHMSTPYDYFHINAVEPLGDGYLVNSRNMWNVFKVDKTGRVEWILNGEHGGDFTLGPDTYFSWQHDARVINHTSNGLYVSLFNNDYSYVQRAVNISDALTLFVDLDKRHAVTTRTLIDRGEHIFSLAMGNAQQLPNGGVFVNYGFGGTFKEYNDKDEVVMTGHFGRGSNRSFFSTYNMYRIDDWHGTPTEPPKIYAEYREDDDETTVWMSWNGATDYDAWRVYAGLESLALKAVGDTVPRSGFETQVVLPGNYTWIQAEALEGDKGMRNSTPAEIHIYYDPDEYYEVDYPSNSTDHDGKKKPHRPNKAKEPKPGYDPYVRSRRQR